jgi:hypothetical protein
MEEKKCHTRDGIDENIDREVTVTITVFEDGLD